MRVNLIQKLCFFFRAFAISYAAHFPVLFDATDFRGNAGENLIQTEIWIQIISTSANDMNWWFYLLERAPNYLLLSAIPTFTILLRCLWWCSTYTLHIIQRSIDNTYWVSDGKFKTMSGRIEIYKVITNRHWNRHQNLWDDAKCKQFKKKNKSFRLIVVRSRITRYFDKNNVDESHYREVLTNEILREYSETELSNQ